MLDPQTLSILQLKVSLYPPLSLSLGPHPLATTILFSVFISLTSSLLGFIFSLVVPFHGRKKVSLTTEKRLHTQGRALYGYVCVLIVTDSW